MAELNEKDELDQLLRLTNAWTKLAEEYETLSRQYKELMELAERHRRLVERLHNNYMEVKPNVTQQNRGLTEGV